MRGLAGVLGGGGGAACMPVGVLFDDARRGRPSPRACGGDVGRIGWWKSELL